LDDTLGHIMAQLFRAIEEEFAVVLICIVKLVLV
jgi:hypothetical protein